MSSETTKRKWYVKPYANAYAGVDPRYIWADLQFYCGCIRHILDAVHKEMPANVTTRIHVPTHNGTGDCISKYTCEYVDPVYVKQELSVDYMDIARAVVEDKNARVVPIHIRFKTTIQSRDGGHWFTTIETLYTTGSDHIRDDDLDKIITHFMTAIERDHNPKVDEFLAQAKAAEKPKKGHQHGGGFIL